MREFSAHPHSQGNSPMTATIHESPAQVKQAPAAIAVSGLVDLADGHAFVRISGYRRGPDDIYVSAAQIRQYGLRKGDLIEGTARPQPNGTARGKFRPLLAVATVNGKSPGLPRPHFDDLTPLYPDERLRLEDGNPSATARIIDLLAPLGKGQRGLLVAPPRSRRCSASSASGRKRSPTCAVRSGARSSSPPSTRHPRTTSGSLSSPSNGPSASWKPAPTWWSCSTPSPGSPGPTTGPRRPAAGPWRAGSRPPPCSRRASSSALPATSKTAARSPSCPPRWWITARAWTTCCSRSSRGPGTWSCDSAVTWPSGASFPPSTR